MTGIPFRAFADLDLVSAAHAVASVLHHGQVDKAGRPYIEHVRDVARRLAEMISAAELIAAGFLHDTVEDGHTTFEALAAVFLKRTVDAVRAVTGRSQTLTDRYEAAAARLRSALTREDT